MGQELREKLLRYAGQARRDGIVSLLDQTDMPELFDIAVRKIVADGDSKADENLLVLRALLAIYEGRSPEELDRLVQSLPAGYRW
jgi:hypothetical protein